MSSDTIVVGVDGSPGAGEALRWAAREARLRGAKLRVVHAWAVPLAVGLPEPSVLGHPMVPQPPFEDEHAALEEKARGLLDSAVEDIDGIEVERELVEEAKPARALLRAAATADLLVVGSRGLGKITGRLLGSVSQECAHASPCPVVIVPTSPGSSAG